MEIKVNQQESFQKLGKDNFLIWKFRAKATLVGLELWSAIEPSEEEKVTAKTKAKALAKLASWVDDENARKIYHLSDPQEVWMKLKSIHEPKDTGHKVNMIGKLFTMKLKPGDDVGDFINEVKELAGKLETNGPNPLAFPEIFLISVVLNGLPKQFAAVVQALKNLDEERLTWTTMEERLLSEFNLLKSAENFNDDEKVFFGQDKAKSVECFYCKKKGHYKRDCRKRLKDQEHQANLGEDFCLSVSEVKDESWIIDSGASRHMTGILHLLQNTSKSEEITIYLANNKTVKSNIKGDVVLECKVKDQAKRCTISRENSSIYT